jgi:hypothetical protein
MARDVPWFFLSPLTLMAQFILTRIQVDGDFNGSSTPSASWSQTGTPNDMQTPVSSLRNSPISIRLQSQRFQDDKSPFESDQIKKLSKNDLSKRVVEVRPEILAEELFPDHAFGFPINNKFARYFHGSFLSKSGSLQKKDFDKEEKTATFLNKTITTIADLVAKKGVPLKPLRYFTSDYANKSVAGHVIKRKPDIILLPLVDGFIPEDPVEWADVKAIVELTTESKPPPRMPLTITSKTFITFCTQLDRDFFICLCFTASGFHIVVSDRVGQIETDEIDFSERTTFLRMVMGLAFLPDSWIGLDESITHKDARKASAQAFLIKYPIHDYSENKSTFSHFDYPSVAANYTQPCRGDVGIISIDSNVYEVVRLLFKSQSLIGRGTTVFLVKLPDGRHGVLKDSWITNDREQEANFLKGLHIPFGPALVDHAVLRDTDTFRQILVGPYEIQEKRQKRRVITYPAGVPISDFSSLWELMVAFLDVVVGMDNSLPLSSCFLNLFLAIRYLESKNLVHRDISYSNILLRKSDGSDAGKLAREENAGKLGLSDVEKLRSQLKCREGLLIDFDYACEIKEDQSFSEESNQGEESDQSLSEETNQGEKLDQSSEIKPTSGSNVERASGVRTVSKFF